MKNYSTLDHVYELIGWTPSQQQNTKKRSEICPKLTIKRIESRSGVFIVNFEHISHFFFSVSIDDF